MRWDAPKVLVPCPSVPGTRKMAITWVSGTTPKLCALWAENSQNFWVGGVRLGYSRESWYVFRVPEKMMFGRTNNVGLDPFSRYSGVRP
jgi:hypothetical protein